MMKTRVVWSLGLFVALCYAAYLLWSLDVQDPTATRILTVIYVASGLVLIGSVLGLRAPVVHVVATTAIAAAATFTAVDQARQDVRLWALWASVPLVVGLLQQSWLMRRRNPGRWGKSTADVDDAPHDVRSEA